MHVTVNFYMSLFKFLIIARSEEIATQSYFITISNNSSKHRSMPSRC